MFVRVFLGIVFCCLALNCQGFRLSLNVSLKNKIVEVSLCLTSAPARVMDILVQLTAVKGKVVVYIQFYKCIFIYFHLLLFNNSHILCLLSDVTSYTDSVASHSQSGYPNRKVHVFLFLKLVLKKKSKKKT